MARSISFLGDMPKANVSSAAFGSCEKGGQGLAKVESDVISCNAAISTCEKVGQWQAALTLFEAMPAAEVQPNVITNSAVIGACERGGQWQAGQSSAGCDQC